MWCAAFACVDGCPAANVAAKPARFAVFQLALLCLILAPVSLEDPTDSVVNDFISKQQVKAADAFNLLYSDGLGIDGEEAPPRESFMENYVVEALNRETKRIMKEKGYAPTPGATSDHSGALDLENLKNVEKKDSPTTLDGEIERLVVQKRQKQAVRNRVRPGKALEIIEPPSAPVIGDTGARALVWDVPCDDALYTKHMYSSIAGCSPGKGSASLPCQRLVIDGFATVSEQEQMVAMMDRSFDGLFHQGEETLLVPEADSQRRMGDKGFALTGELLERARLAVARTLNISQFFYSGSLLKRLDHPPIVDEWQVEESHDSSNPHVDKANIASYDWSCLLYFNSVGKDFGGGELAFNDLDADRIVRPLGGRLVAFSSGLENLHRVLPMKWGKRYVLSMWFTCSDKHAHPKLGISTSATRNEL